MDYSGRVQRERDEMQLLTNARAGEMLRLAFADVGIVRSWQVHQVHHRPGAGVSVGYSVVVDQRKPFARRDVYVLASSASISDDKLLAVGGKRLRLGQTRVSIWEYPLDPELPGLKIASDTERFSEFLGEPVDLELLGYRPTRRAVVRANREGRAPVFAKVIRPTEQAQMEHRLEIVERAGVPGPRLHRTAHGLIVMEAVAGVPLSRLLSWTSKHTDRNPRPDKAALRVTLRSLEETLDALPHVALGLKPRPAWADRARHYASAAALTIPEHEAVCVDTAAEIEELLAHADLGTQVPAHGDFYEANVYVDPTTGKLCGILDLDSLSAGYRVHDWGCLLGHMSVLPGLAPQIYDGVQEIVDDWFECLQTSVDPVALATSAAGVTLSLIAGSRKSRKQWTSEAQARLKVTQAWVRRAKEYAGK